jgi:hypothetical protein
MRRRDIVAAAAGAVAATVLAGGVAWAAIPGDGGAYSACMLKNVGTVRLIDKSLPPGNLMSRCKPALEVEISWNQQGPPGLPGAPGGEGDAGEDGVSPTVAQIGPGDPNCPTGGASITDAAGSVAYVCSGRDGTDGEPFAGTFESPNGQYVLSVTDAGIRLANGPGTRIDIAADEIDIRAREDVDIRADMNANLQAGLNANVEADAITDLRGTVVRANAGSSCRPVARIVDTVLVNPATGEGAITSGSGTVCIGS